MLTMTGSFTEGEPALTSAVTALSGWAEWNKDYNYYKHKTKNTKKNKGDVEMVCQSG